MAAYLGDIRFELIKMLRTPAFALPTLVFPAMFYLLFGVLLAQRQAAARPLYSFAAYGVFGTMGPGLFGFGVSLAFEREHGLLMFKQALPMPPGAYLLARACHGDDVRHHHLVLLTLMLANSWVTCRSASCRRLKVYVIDVLGVLPFCAHRPVRRLRSCRDRRLPPSST